MLAPEIDLFSTDVAASPAPADATFDAFQSAPTDTSTKQNSEQFDAFGDFSSPVAQSQTQQQSSAQFDAFGVSSQATQSVSSPTPNMNMMGGNPQMNNMNAMFNQMNMGQQNQMGLQQMNMNQMNMNQMHMNQMNMNQMNQMNMAQQPANSANFGAMMGGQQAGAQDKATAAPAVQNDDDFGDFADANQTKSVNTSADPMSKLISLDGLTKNNESKKKSKANDPIIYNAAAAQYIQDKNSGGVSTINSQLAFQGVDGLNKTPNLAPKVANNRLSANQVMGAGVQQGGSEAISGLFAPMGGNTTAMNSMGNNMASMNNMGNNMAGMNHMGGMNSNVAGMNNMGGMHNNMAGMNMNNMGGNMNNMNNMNMHSMGMMGNQGNNMMGNGAGGMSGNMMGNQGGNKMGGQGGNIMGHQGGNQMGGQATGGMMGGQPMSGWH